MHVRGKNAWISVFCTRGQLMRKSLRVRGGSTPSPGYTSHVEAGEHGESKPTTAEAESLGDRLLSAVHCDPAVGKPECPSRTCGRCLWDGPTFPASPLLQGDRHQINVAFNSTSHKPCILRTRVLQRPGPLAVFLSP